MTNRPPHHLLSPDTFPLGFGCGNLSHGIGRRESLHLLEAAIDYGINYFDTARMYGFGRAEGILGQLTPRNRKRMVIATKAGILPANRTLPLRLLNRGIKEVHKFVPPTQRYLSTPASVHPRFGFFKTSDIRKSVETSLRELHTDYIDIFLLHECRLADVQYPELLDFLEGLKREGKIRAFGLATGIEETVAIAKALPAFSRVMQISNNAWEANLARLPHEPGALIVTHSCLGNRFRDLVHRLACEDDLAREWESFTEVDPHDKTAVAQLFLFNSLRDNPGGVVIFSSSKPENIQSNIKMAAGSTIDTSQIKGLRAFVAKNWGM